MTLFNSIELFGQALDHKARILLMLLDGMCSDVKQFNGWPRNRVVDKKFFRHYANMDGYKKAVGSGTVSTRDSLGVRPG